jgi:hypothetical protein
VLAKFLALFGFDLHRQMELVKDRAEDFARQTTTEITNRIRDLGLTMAFAATGAVFGLITLVIGLMALYSWVAATYGPLAGYAVIGGMSALLTAAMLIVASRRGAAASPDSAVSSPGAGSVRPEVEATQEPIADSPRTAVPEPQPLRPDVLPAIPLALDLRRPLSGALQDFLAKPPTTGTPIDAVIRRAMNEAHAASPQAVDMAADLLRTGPRSAQVGLLVGFAMLGWLLARNGGFLHSLTRNRLSGDFGVVP